jgi:23S rRNA (uridine2552-2'-O)-methyltransferase
MTPRVPFRPGKRRKAASATTAQGSGARTLTSRVETAKGRRSGSTRWLNRQLNDPYVQAAQRQGYRSRAAFKLLEMDERLHLLRPGQRVVDLGAAPGGWTQVAAQRVRAADSGGHVVAVDYRPMAPIPGAIHLEIDMTAEDAPQKISSALNGAAQLVLSDMAPDMIGEAMTDHLRSMALGEAALALAMTILAPGGGFVVKLLQGRDLLPFVVELRRLFASVRQLKPPASRLNSSEVYVVATGLRRPD